MRALTGMKLINWHFFENETVKFDGSTLITGDNGTGKSTLIDALQVVVIGNLKKVKFNSSAIEDRTTRDLKGYLRGKTGTEGGEKFLRNKDFTSYIVLEITHTAKNEKYLIGAVFDYYEESGEEEHVFFKIDEEGLHDDLFFREEGLPFNRRDFFRYLKSRGIKHRQYKNDLSGYIYDVRQLFGGVKESFFSLFQKGISFNPITDLRRFVYDYILEEREIDVDTMRDYFEKYRQVDDMIKETEKEIAELRVIEERYRETENLVNQIKVSEYMKLRGQLEEKLAEVRDKRKEKWKKEERLQELDGRLLEIRTEEKNLKEEIEQLQLKIDNNRVFIRKSEINAELKFLRSRLEDLKKEETNLYNQLRAEVREWEDMIEALRKVDAPFEMVNLLLEGRELWNLTLTREKLSFPLQAERLWNTWKRAAQWLNESRSLWKKEAKEAEQRITELKQAIGELERNQVLSSGHPTMVLKGILEENLADPEGDTVPVSIFCEAIEIKNESWRNAVEGYLHTQKFDLLVPPAYFDEALSLYERYKFSHRIERVGLVNTGKLLQKVRPPLKNSLAEEVEAETDYIAAYAHWLLGGIIKCASEKELKKHTRSITASCMLYQNHTVRQIPRERYEIPYIGREAVKFQLQRKRKELTETEKALKEWQQKLKMTSFLTELSPGKEDRYRAWEDSFKRIKEKEATEEKILELQQELMRMDDSELRRLEKQKKEKEATLEDIREKHSECKKEKAVEEERIRFITGEITSSAGEAAERGKRFDEFIKEINPQLVEQCHEKWRREVAEKSPARLVRNYEISAGGLKTKLARRREGLITLRSDFVHRYNFYGDPRAEDNREFSERLNKLVESHLKEYRQKAEAAREQAERAFQEHFVASLREAIELAREEIKELNQALKDMRFGTDSYYFRLTVKRDMKAYYDMIMDPDLHRGVTLFSDSFVNRHKEALERFFREINSRDDNFQEKMQELTDYRSYLDFEIVITDESGNKSHFSKVARDKSGGETQVPFYVAILASFYQAYHMYRKRDTLRLVVFDEAFNRMDADRIEEAVRFIKKLDFQAVIVTPTGRIQLIVPHVNTNLIVMREGFTSFVERVSRKEIEEWN